MFPEKYSMMVVGAPDAGVLEFCTYLASFYLRRNQNVVFVESDTSRTFLRRQLHIFGIKHDEYDDHSLIIIDCFSEPASFEDPAHFANPSDLPELLTKIKSAYDTLENPKSVIFDSLSSLHIYNTASDVRKFLSKLIEATKKTGSLTTSLYEKMHPIQITNGLINLCDGLIEMRVDESLRRFIRIRRMKDLEIEPKWVPFEPQQEAVSGTALIWKK